jgi:hypothetical protein
MQSALKVQTQHLSPQAPLSLPGSTNSQQAQWLGADMPYAAYSSRDGVCSGGKEPGRARCYTMHACEAVAVCTTLDCWVVG